MTEGTMPEYAGRHKPGRRAWIPYAIPALLLIFRFVFEFTFDGYTGNIVNSVGRFCHDSRVEMAMAGWLTIAFLPLAVDVFVTDRHRRLGGDRSGVAHMTTRNKAARGHGLAPRPMAHWIRRIPMLLAFALAVLFWPLTGASMASQWTATIGGVAFAHGWRISLVGAALGIVVILAEPWLRPGIKRWALLALPALALAAALVIR
jgi:hypothetical protein